MKSLVTFICFLLLTGCASVKVSNIDSQEYLKQRRGDVISEGRLSDPSNTVLTSLGLTDCENRIEFCINQVNNSTLIDEDEKLSSLAEMWLFQGMQRQKSEEILKSAGEYHDEKILARKLINDYLEATKYAYAYLFYSGRSITSRALEDRQTQVKDYYNFAVQNIIEQLYRSNKGKKLSDFPLKEGRWNISIHNAFSSQSDGQVENIREIIPDTVLSFKGLKNQYTADGLGARLVLSLENENKENMQPWRQMPYASVTAMVTFKGDNLNQVLDTHDAVITTYDPTITKTIIIGQTTVPLSANFSSAYGLWLANSNFASASLSTIFGRGTIIDKPTVYLMSPYKKELKTIILIHGLASSPDAWVNTANEIMGDKELREQYQIWQVYYPTNVPILLNRAEISEAIRKTISHFDPKMKNKASNDIVLIGHSMGGVLSRLLVSDSGERIIDALRKKYPKAAERLEKSDSKYTDIISFNALPGITEAIFLAAPHQGTPYADASWARYLASFVKLPLSVVNTLGEVLLVAFGQELPRGITMTGVDNLSAKDPTILLLKDLPISPKVQFHSIIGREDAAVPLLKSSDGIVPYWSSHLDGAKSEHVFLSGHSVQENPQAIIEIRNILREHDKIK